MATADFKINSTLQATRGYDATTSEAITLTLENAPAVDVFSVVYSVVSSSDGAPALTLSPSTGIPTTPTGNVTFTMPGSGFHSYLIQCQVNAGKSTNNRGALVVNSDYTKQRVISIRGAVSNVRKTVPAETTQYEEDGWNPALNELADAFENGTVGGTPTSRTLTAGAGLTGGGDLSADRTFNIGAHADASIVVNANDIQVGALGFTRVQTALAAASGSIAVNSQKITGLAAGVNPTDAANVSQITGTTYVAGDGLTESPSGTFNVSATDSTVTIAANGIKVATGGITNTEVSASAAIAGTKVDPAFGSQNISTTGTIGGGAITGTSLLTDGAIDRATAGTGTLWTSTATAGTIGDAGVTVTLKDYLVVQKDAIGSADSNGLLLDNATSSGSSEQRPPVFQQGGYGHKTGGGGSQVKCYATRRVRLPDGTSNPDIEVYEQYDLGGSVGVFGTWTTNLPGIAGTGLYLNSTLVLGGSSNGVRGSGGGNPGLAFTGGWDCQVKAPSTDVVLNTNSTDRVRIANGGNQTFSLPATGIWRREFGTVATRYTDFASKVFTSDTAGGYETALSYTLPDNSTAVVIVWATAKDTTSGDAAGYGKRRTVKRFSAGAATTVGSERDLGADDEDDATWSLRTNVTGNTVFVEVEGDGTNAVKWGIDMEVHITLDSA